MVADQLGGWVYRCATKLNTYLEKIGHGEIATEGRMNHEIFEDIQIVTGRFIDELPLPKDRVKYEYEEAEAGLEDHDLEEDLRALRSEQYLTKNIRIIPTGTSDDVSMRGDDYEEEQKFHTDA